MLVPQLFTIRIAYYNAFILKKTMTSQKTILRKVSLGLKKIIFFLKIAIGRTYFILISILIL